MDNQWRLKDFAYNWECSNKCKVIKLMAMFHLMVIMGFIFNPSSIEDCLLSLSMQLELFVKSHQKLQFVYSKRKNSTKLSKHPKLTKKNLDQSVRQPMRDHSTSRECSHHCLHHLPTLVPKLPPCLGWVTVEFELIYCLLDLLNEVPKARIKL